MNNSITTEHIEIILLIAIALRAISMGISKVNEKKLKKMGAVEYGRRNSTLLMLAHFAFYGSCLVEGYRNLHEPDTIAQAGLALYVMAIGILYYVIYELRHIWTIKLFIAPRHYHVLVRSFLFRHVKHSNYYLSIIPELCGISMIFHAWYTLFFGLPLYLVPLCIRIKQEELAMMRELNHY